MTKRVRALLAAASLLTALATAGSALASYAPKLTVKSASGATNGQVTVIASVGQADDPTARTQIYIPAGYTVTTTAAPGTKLGAVTAKASAADLSGTVLSLDGALQVIPPNPTAQAQCGVPASAATWDMHLSAATQTLDIPLYVVQNSGPEGTAGAYKLVVCLPPPDVPVGTPGRAVFGAKLISATFTSSAIVSPTTLGQYRWTSLWTPYTPTKGTPNAAGSVEAQSLVRLPSALRITSLKRTRGVRTVTAKVKGKKVRRHVVRTTVVFKAKVTEAGAAAAGAKVTGRANGKTLGSATTSTSGLATGAFVFDRGSVSLAVTATIPDRDLGATGCIKTAVFGGLPCVDATEGGSTNVATARVTAFRK